MMPPPPSPWRPRARISIGMFGAIAHSTEPATNRLSEMMIMTRRP
jgi:hypothetical protein